MALKKSVTDDTVALLQTLVRNKCVNPPGDELRSIHTIRDYLTKHNIDCQVYESDSNRGNLVARIKGTGTGPSLMLGPAHVDVVPIGKPEAWNVDPFEGLIKDGHVWGRGTLDMLFIVAAQVQTFVELSKEKFQPKGDLVLVIVSDEEAGGLYGIEWLVKNKPEMMKVDYAVGELGGIPMEGNRLIYCIGEKGTAWKRITFKGTPEHGSSPYRSDNAVVKAGIAAGRLAKYNPPLEMHYVKDMVAGIGMSKFIQALIGIKPLFPLILSIIYKKSPSIAKLLHALSRMTISPDIIHGGLKTNIIPGEAYLDVDIRVLPGQNDEYVIRQLRKAMGNLGKEALIEVPPDQKGFFKSSGSVSETTPEFLAAMKEAVSEFYPDVNFIPTMLSGATDLRYIRQLGGNAFGFSLFGPNQDVNELGKLAHGPNECISLTAVEYTVNAYYKLAKSLLG